MGKPTTEYSRHNIRKEPWLPFIAMITTMIGVTREVIKILKPIIVGYSVDVMDFLRGVKYSAYRLLYYEPMFINITAMPRKWMIREVNLNISPRMFASAASPIPMSISSMVSFKSFIPRDTAIFKMIPSLRVILKISTIAFFRAEFLLPRQQFLFANKTSPHECYYTLKVV